jgi:hypothetical protein
VLRLLVFLELNFDFVINIITCCCCPGVLSISKVYIRNMRYVMKEAEVRLYHKRTPGFCGNKLSCVVMHGVLPMYNTFAELVQFLYLI